MATKSNKPVDITKGGLNYRDLQRINASNQSGRTYNLDADTEYWKSLARARGNMMQSATGWGATPVRTDLYNNSDGRDYWGKSRYDDDFSTDIEGDYLNDTRYDNQGWYDNIANGIVKMGGTALTTLLNSTVGMANGIYTAIDEGRWSGLWDNETTQALSDVDRWFEENFTNYRSTEQKNNAWYDPSNLFSTAAIADNIIKNAGFTIGAAASGAITSSALGLVKGLEIGSKAAAVIGAALSGAGEGAIEAKQGVEERNKLELQKLKDTLRPEYEAIQAKYEANKGTFIKTPEGKMIDVAAVQYEKDMADLNQKLAEGKRQIEEDGQRMGNRVMALNTALLTMDNLMVLGKGLSKSYKNAAKWAKTHPKAEHSELIKNTGSILERAAENKARREASKDALKTAQTKVGSTIFDNKFVAYSNPLIEGQEEMNQQWIQSGVGAYYQKDDPNDYWRMRLDPENVKQTASISNAIMAGLKGSWEDPNQWEQFVIGGLTGLTGTWMPTKLFNQDKTKSRWDPRRYGSWEGSMFSDIHDYNERRRKAKENSDAYNQMLQDNKFWDTMKSINQGIYNNSKAKEAAEAGDKKTFKDFENKEMAGYINTAINAGKIDDLKAILSFYSDLSDAQIESLVKETTSVTSAGDRRALLARVRIEIPKEEERLAKLRELQAATPTSDIATISSIAQQIVDTENRLNELRSTRDLNTPDDQIQDLHEGVWVDSRGNRTATNEEIREELNKNAQSLLDQVDRYIKASTMVQNNTGGVLTRDQDDELTYLAFIGGEKIERVRQILQKIRKSLPSKVRLKLNHALSDEFIEGHPFLSGRTTAVEGKENEYVVDTTGLKDDEYATFVQGFIFNSNRETLQDWSKSGMTSILADTTQETEELNEKLKGLVDSIQLTNESREYYKKLNEFMNDPSKVDEEKAAEQSRIQGQLTDEQLNNMSKNELINGSLDGSIDLESAFNNSQSAENKSKIEEVKKTVSRAEALDNAIQNSDMADELKAIAKQMLEGSLQSTENIEELTDLDKEEFNDFNAEIPLSDEEQAELAGLSEEDTTLFAVSRKERKLQEIKAELKSIFDKFAANSEELESLRTGGLGEEVERTTVAGMDPSSDLSPVEGSGSPEEEIKLRADEGALSKDADTMAAEEDKENNREDDKDKNDGPRTYWKANTTEYALHGKVGDTTPFHETAADHKKELHKAIHDFLKNNVGTFDLINSDQVKANTKVMFAMSKTLNSNAKTAVPLIVANIGGRQVVIGDLLSIGDNDALMDKYPNLRETITKLTEYFNKVKDTINDDVIVLPGIESTIREMLVGRPLYTAIENMLTLNEIADGQPFLLGIDTGTQGNKIKVDSDKVRDRLTKTERLVRMPLSRKAGTPYILIKTSSNKDGRGYIPVPFIMPRYDYNNPTIAGSRLGKEIFNATERLKDINSMTPQARKELEYELQSLLSIDYIQISEGKPHEGVPSDKYVIKVTVRPGESFNMSIKKSVDATGLGAELRKKLTEYKTSFNVDHTKINDGDYNSKIGELAKTNLAKGALHTVNDFPILDYFDSEGNTVTAVPPALSGVSSLGYKVTIDRLGYKGDLYINMATNEIVTKDGKPALVSDEIKSLVWCRAHKVPIGRVQTPWSKNHDGGDFLYRKGGMKFVPKVDKAKKDRSKAVMKNILEEQKDIKHPNSEDNPKNVYVVKGKESERVHTVMGSNWVGESSTTAELNGNRAKATGTIIDDICRQFFEGVRRDKSGKLVIPLIRLKTEERAVLSDEAYNNLLKYLCDLQEYFDDTAGTKGYTEKVYANNIVLHATINGVDVAGELDLVTIDEYGNFRVYDMKTSTHPFDVVNYETKRSSQIKSTKEEHTEQQSFYEYMLLQKGAEMAKDNPLNIIPMMLDFGGNATVEGGHTKVLGLRGLHTIPLTYNPSIVNEKTKAFGGSNKTKIKNPTQAQVNNVLSQADFNSKSQGKGPLSIPTLRQLVFDNFDVAESEVNELVDKFLKGDSSHNTVDTPFQMDKESGSSVGFIHTKSDGSKVFIPEASTMGVGILTLTNGKLTPVRYSSDIRGKNVYSSPIIQVDDGAGGHMDLPKDSVLGYYYKDKYGKIHAGLGTEEKIVGTFPNWEDFEKELAKLKIPSNPPSGVDTPAFNREASIKALSRTYAGAASGKKVSEILNDLTDAQIQAIEKAKTAAKNKINRFFAQAGSLSKEERQKMFDNAVKYSKVTNENRDSKVWDKNKELSTLGRMLPQLSREDRIKILETIDMISDNPDVEAWGKFEDGIITLAENTAEGTAYHEAFHYVLNTLTSLKEYNNAFESARQEWGNLSNDELEEKMADGFKEYVLYRENASLGQRIKNFFKDLLADIKHFFKVRDSLPTMYSRIYRGKYKERNTKSIYVKEMRDIKAKAKANGTFMKAPNGADTHLTEKQWLQVRTKAFKEWFGDWERVAKNNLGSASGNIDVSEILNKDGSINFEALEKVSDEYFKNADESLFRKGRKTLRTRKEHHEGESNTLEHLQNVVKSAELSDIREDLKPQLLLAAALHDLAKPFHGGQKHGFQSVDVINSIFKGDIGNLAKFAIRHHMMTIDEDVSFRQEDANRIIQDAIDNNLNVQDAIDILLALNIADITRGRELSTIDQYAKKPLIDVINEEIPIKRAMLEKAAARISSSDVSKVVDENGEPKVLHHFATATFDVFDSKFNKGNNKGFYFGTLEQAEVRSQMEEEDVPNSRYLDVFINLRNPTYTNFDNRGKDYYKNNDGLIIDVSEQEAKELASFGFNQHWEEFVREWVVKNPNQIKSATDNIGSFDNNNPNIKYSVRRYKNFSSLLQQDREILESLSITPELYNRLTPNEQERVKHCLL